MSDLISREEAMKALGDIHPLDYNAQAYKAKITAIPSADILEHAKAIKERCAGRDCSACELNSDSGCSVKIPVYWRLPERRNE